MPIMNFEAVQYLDSRLFGGVEQMVLQILSGLPKTGWRTRLLHHGGVGLEPLLDTLRSRGIPERAVPSIEAPGRVARLIRFSLQLRREKPHVFHAHLNWPLGCRHGLLAARLAGVRPRIATLHLYSSIDGVRFPRLKRALHYSNVDQVIAVSHEVKDRLCLELGVRPSRVHVLHNGIRLEPFLELAGPSAAYRASLIGDDRRPIVFTPARLHVQKGQTYLVEAARLVPEAIFLLAGEGPDAAMLEGRARELGVDSRVRFLGRRTDVPELLAACEVFVLPSLYEGLPVSVIEAMAAAKPIVATAIGGTKEALTNEVDALLVPPRDPKALAGAIRRLLSDRGLAKRLSEAARHRALESFSLEPMIRKTARLYEALTATPEPSRGANSE